MNRGFRRTPLSIDIHESAHEESFIANGEIFIKDNVAINRTGIAMRDNPKTFTLVYDEIEMGDMIGRGSSSIVLHGIHSPTGTPLALKIINLFDKSKREQLIREIITLYDAQCPNLITFYGAFYREGVFNADRKTAIIRCLSASNFRYAQLRFALISTSTITIKPTIPNKKNFQQKKTRIHNDSIGIYGWW